MSKKLIIIAVSVVAVIAVVICGIVIGTSVHIHEFGEWTVLERASCEADGIKTRKCKSCDETEQTTIKATGHTYGNFISEVPATCTQEGVKEHYECSACHKFFDVNKIELSDPTIAKTAHTYGDWVEEIPATCTTDGTKGYYECSACNKYFDEDDNEIAELSLPKGHSLNLVNGKKATCTEDGIKDVYRCAFCREFFDEEGNAVVDKVIPATGHTYGDLIDEVPATATENGVKEHKDCTVCGLHFDADGNEIGFLVIPATGHTYSAWIEEIPATCTEDGTKGHYECGHCSLTFDENYEEIKELILPAGHKLEFHAGLEPTCGKDGHIALYTCENCSVILDENGVETTDYVLTALGHVFGEWVTEIPATCTENGVKGHKTCSRCEENFDENEKIIDVKIRASHDFESFAEESATCTESGRQAYDHCLACGKNYDVFGNEINNLTDVVIPAKNHAYGDWINAIGVTCTESGLVGHYHCRNCNKDYGKNDEELSDVIIPALGHIYKTEEIIPLKDATCVEDGYVAHFECERCGAYTDESDNIIESIVIEKNGHTPGEYVSIVYPTCTETGVDGYYYCSECGDCFSFRNYYVTVTVEDLVLQPTGHKYLHYDREEPQCEVEGREEYYVCGECYKYFDAGKREVEFEELYVEKTGHDFGDWIKELPATETEDGYIGHYQCKKCLYCFDKDKYMIGGTIVIPKTVHVFDKFWVQEVPATCTTAGRKGYYECSHCNQKFDFNYKEITDLTIPAHHNVGALTPAFQAKCDDDDILIPYYYCNDCRNYLDENMAVRRYDEIFRQADRHDDVVTIENEWCHSKKCRDCGREAFENHNYTFSYFTENNAPVMKGTCTICGYETESESYRVVTDVNVISDIYVGYHSNGMFLFRIRHRDGNAMNVHASTVMNEDDRRRFEALVESPERNFDPFTEKFTVSYQNFTSEIEVTFRPFVVYGVVTEENSYQNGSLSGLNEVRFIYDCNYTRETGNMLYLDGTIIDDGGFEPEFDFDEEEGPDSKIFTVKYNVGGTEYTVSVKITASVKPAYINHDNDYDWTLRDQPLFVEVVYSDGSSENVEITDEMIISGSFNPSVLGKQTVTVNIQGLIQTITVNVRDPFDVRYLSVVSDQLNIGEKLRLSVHRLNNESDIVEVTPDMIEGVFDGNVAGTYDITIVYGDALWVGSVTVSDPGDSRVDNIGSIFGSYLVWDVKDGEIVENLDFLYITVNRKNKVTDYVKVTSDMISYDKTEAAEALKNNRSFRLLISYYGKTCSVYVSPRVIADQTVTNIYVYDAEKLSYGHNPTMYMKDGDLSNYFVRVTTTGNGYYLLPVTEDMFYISNDDGGSDELVPFDFGNIENGKDYYVTLKYAQVQSYYFYLLAYTESDVEYYFTWSDSDSFVVGSKDEVIARLAGMKFSLYRSVCGYSSLMYEFFFEDLVLAPNEDVDFSKPGYLNLTASYKGIVGNFSIELIPDVSDVKYTDYRVPRIGMLRMYENGYACLNDSWGTYVLISERLNIWQFNSYGWRGTLFFAIEDGKAEIFKAEMLEENLEVYTVFNMEGLCVVKVYTKNGLSLADIYDEDDEYDSTARVSFSPDGRYLYMNGKKYTIGEDDSLVILPEGNVVYLYDEGFEGNRWLKGTLNDNGMFYMYISVLDADDNVEAEYLVEVFAWEEKNGVIRIYSGDDQVTKGIIVDGYLIIND